MSDAWDAVRQDVAADVFPEDQRDADVEKSADQVRAALVQVFLASARQLDRPGLLDEAGPCKPAAVQFAEQSCAAAVLRACVAQRDARQSVAVMQAEQMLPEALPQLAALLEDWFAPAVAEFRSRLARAVQEPPVSGL